MGVGGGKGVGGGGESGFCVTVNGAALRKAFVPDYERELCALCTAGGAKAEKLEPVFIDFIAAVAGDV